jgi:branched-chain amino acid transport system substrate-binding protein
MKIYKKIVVGGGIVLLIILGLLFSNRKVDIIKIGVIGHFSGEYASYSVPMKNGMELALNKLDPGRRKYELVVEDDGANASQAASAMNKLVNIDKVNYILSAQGSGATSVIIPIAEGNKRILMVTLASAPSLLKDTNYIFRTVPSDVYQGVKMVSYLNDVLKAKRVSGLYANDPYGIGIRDIIEKQNKGLNTISELFTPGSNDYRTNLLKIKQQNPDTLVLVARESEYPLILKQIKELGIVSNIVTSETFKDDKILANTFALAEGAVTFMAEPKDYVDFVSEYKKVYSEEPSAYSMYGYDGMVALLKAISKAGDDVEKVKQVLHKIEENGASGIVSFDEIGDRTGVEYSTYKVINGEFVSQK